MTNIPKIPLADRLRQAAAKQNKVTFFRAFCLYMDTYLFGLDKLLGGTSYSDAMDPCLEKYEHMPLLMRFVTDICKLPAEERDRLLCQILVQPFAEIQRQKESENECLPQLL